MDNLLYIAHASEPLHLHAKMANRHGLITGATGTGKTVTMQGMAEGFSRLGVPVFFSDIKGDISGISEPGGDNKKVAERVEMLALNDFQHRGYPVQFWDIFAKDGMPVRTTISEMGPLLLARLLDLNETQRGVLNLVFKVADDNGLLLLDLKDLKSTLAYVADNAKDFTAEYGNVSRQSVGAIQRSLLVIESQGGEEFFGEPALDINDFFRTSPDGLGMINILSCTKLFQMPDLYATFMLWLLSELFEALPEVGDLDKPKMVFFFDEAHLLFTDTPKALLTQIEQVVRLIRSKGVGVYFVTQNPVDIPESVLGQLGNRVQHALRAYTPKDQKAIRAAAQTFRQNPAFDVETTITELGVGEALISFLDEKGIPGIVERAYVLPPESKIGPASDGAVQNIIRSSPFYNKYAEMFDRYSAYEMLQEKLEREAAAREIEEQKAEAAKQMQQQQKQQQKRTSSGRKKNTLIDSMTKSAVNTMGRQVGRELVRGVLGSLRR